MIKVKLSILCLFVGGGGKGLKFVYRLCSFASRCSYHVPLSAPTRSLPLPARQRRVARVRQHNLLIKTLMEDSRFVAQLTLRRDKRHLALFYTFTFIIHLTWW